MILLLVCIVVATQVVNSVVGRYERRCIRKDRP